MPAAESHPRTPAWEWAQTVLLAVNLSWTTLCLGGYVPATMVITSSLTGLLLALHFAGLAFNPRRLHPAGWLLVPFVIYGACNVLWVTPVRWLGWLDWYGWVHLVAIFWVALNGVRSAGPRRVLFNVLVALAIVSVLLACHQRFVDPKWLMLGRTQAEQFFGRASGPFGSPNSLAAFLLLTLPALGALTLRRGASVVERVLWGWISLVVTFGFVLTISRGGWMALALALGLWPLTAPGVAWSRRIGLSAAVFGAALLLAGGLIFAAPKVRERFVGLTRDAGERTRPILWRAAWELVRSEPIHGTGAGSYNTLFEKYRPERFPDEPQWAHNDYLNTLSDYGATGFLLFFGAWAAIAGRCARVSREVRVDRPAGWIDDPVLLRGLGVGLAAFAVQLSVDFHFKIPALAMAFATVGALAVGRAWPPSDLPLAESALARAGFSLLGTATVVGLFIQVVPTIRGEAQRYRARQQIDALALGPMDEAAYRARLAPALEGLAQAVRLSPANGQAWSDLSYARSLWAHVEPKQVNELGREAEAAAERALAVSPLNAEFWIRRGVARDMQGRWLEGGGDFTTAIGLAAHNPLAWYYYAEHLSRKSSERKLAEAALAFCLRLDPGNRAGLALRQRLAFSRSAL